MQHIAARHITPWIYCHHGRSWCLLENADSPELFDLIWFQANWCWREIQQCGIRHLSSPNVSVLESAEAKFFFKKNLAWISAVLLGRCLVGATWYCTFLPLSWGVQARKLWWNKAELRFRSFKEGWEPHESSVDKPWRSWSYNLKPENGVYVGGHLPLLGLSTNGALGAASGASSGLLL